MIAAANWKQPHKLLQKNENSTSYQCLEEEKVAQNKLKDVVVTSTIITYITEVVYVYVEDGGSFLHHLDKQDEQSRLIGFRKNRAEKFFNFKYHEGIRKARAA